MYLLREDNEEEGEEEKRRKSITYLFTLGRIEGTKEGLIQLECF